MKYVAAYVLLSLGGKTNVSEKDLSDYLKAIGSEVNEDQVKAVVSALHGKSLNELATKGLAKISTMSFGSGAPAPAQAAPAKKDAPAKAAPEPVEEPEVEMDLGDMFG